jgi:LysM repeat protein
MKINRFTSIIVLLLLFIGLTACTRSLPTASPAQDVEATSQDLPVEGTAVMDTLYALSTQTAMAAQQGQPTLPIPPESQPTQPVIETTNLPPSIPEPTQTPVPTQPAIVAPTATPGLPASYTLRKGEFPFCIARRFDVNPTEMLQLSGLPVAQTYPPGTVLRIPQNGSPFPGNRTLRARPTTYVVQSGDTIYSIACLFGDVAPEAIAFVNNLAKPFTLTAGQTINIP